MFDAGVRNKPRLIRPLPHHPHRRGLHEQHIGRPVYRSKPVVKIKVLYFAPAPHENTVRVKRAHSYRNRATPLHRLLLGKYLHVTSTIDSIMFALNAEYFDDMTLTDGDEVALIPPISGGE
uniref:Molybdopterin synthase sulfur carrier subunit n=1 Tax=Peronospora matthiolae TaxID=2874970 RepID=A0AAV1U5F9_9STRA